MSVESFVGRGINQLVSERYASEHRKAMTFLSVDFSIKDEIFALARMLQEKWDQTHRYRGQPFTIEPLLNAGLFERMDTIEEFIERLEKSSASQP